MPKLTENLKTTTIYSHLEIHKSKGPNKEDVRLYVFDEYESKAHRK